MVLSVLRENLLQASQLLTSFNNSKFKTVDWFSIGISFKSQIVSSAYIDTSNIAVDLHKSFIN